MGSYEFQRQSNGTRNGAHGAPNKGKVESKLKSVDGERQRGQVGISGIEAVERGHISVENAFVIVGHMEKFNSMLIAAG